MMPKQGGLQNYLDKRVDDNDDDDETPLDRVKQIYEYMRDDRAETPSKFDNCLLSQLNISSLTVSPKDPNIMFSTWDLHVSEDLCNGMGNLHGGMAATVFDVTTSFTVFAAAHKAWRAGHVSRNLDVVYLRPAPAGTDLIIENEVVHLGKSLGLIKAIARRKSDGAVCYTCNHDKAVVKPRL